MKLEPIYTEKTQCQDCYKCVRECPVKAIRVVDGSAMVIPKACILCGHCTQICPVNAKKIRDDLEEAKGLIAEGHDVYVSLAPSYVTEFPNLKPGRLISAIKKLGFKGVSETALGAQEVSAACAQLLNEGGNKLWISTCCPSTIHMIEQYHPELVEFLTPVLSPLQAHAKMLKNHYGPETKVIFIGPCVAKKNEANGHFELALTFNDLRRWFTQNNIDWTDLDDDEEFVPKSAHEGGLYPVDGGMVDGIKLCGAPENTLYMGFTGVKQVQEALEDIKGQEHDCPVFVEILACEGGCVNGPVVSKQGSTASKRIQIYNNTPMANGASNTSELDFTGHFSSREIPKVKYTEDELSAALLKVSKKRKEDELNCGGCGYDTCRDFAAALLQGKAEPAMCVSYLRKLAQTKASALIQTMPSGVVIVDEDLRIIESNRQFIDLIGGEASIIGEADPNLEGAYLERLVPFHNYFTRVLQDPDKADTKDIRYQGKILRLTIFNIQNRHVVGGIIQDITEPVIQREQIMEKASEVMKKNISTVQKIAFLLGENAADSEVLLNSIIESFKDQEE
jgi:iron only hydrogenase large subunit-like protein